MLQRHYEVLVYGATFAGLGIAMAAKDKALVVERSALAGNEFIACYNPGDSWQSRLESEPSAELRAELISRNLLTDDGLVHLPAIVPTLCRWIRAHRLNVRMLTEIVDIQKSGDGYEVTLFSPSGLERVTAAAIIDTTPERRSVPAQAAPIASKRINALLHCRPADAVRPVVPAAQAEGVELFDSRFAGELIFSLPLEPEDDWHAARAKLHGCWSRHAEAFAPWTLAASGDTFDIRTDAVETRIDERWSWFPSSSYANLLQAFDAGYLKGVQLYETIAAGQ